jgi:predicted TIM-barrel fold metal-dependent hydrolase
MPNGADAVQSEDGSIDTIGLTRNVGVPFDQLPTQISKFSEPIGNGPPEHRLWEQDQDGVEAEVMFTWAERMLRGTKDDECYLALVDAYNAYLAEEYMAVAPDRLLPLGIIPKTGVDDAIKELEHCARLGLKGIQLVSLPSGHGYPTPEDDRFWAAALEMGMPLTKHGGNRFQGKTRGEPPFMYPNVIHSEDNHKADAIELLFSSNATNSAYGVMQLAYAGVWDRFPKLQMYFAETYCGWLPATLFMVDDNYRRYQPFMRHFWGLEDLERQPSEYIREHAFWGILYDPVGIKNRDPRTVDKLMWSNDFAHAAGDWPNSLKTIADMFASVPDEERHTMLAGNAVRYFHLDE